MATVFKRDGVRRKLTTKCGTLAYMAPEMFNPQKYEGDAVDIWSSGIVLFVMLQGSTANGVNYDIIVDLYVSRPAVGKWNKEEFGIRKLCPEVPG